MLNQNSGEIENWGAEANVGYQFNPVWSVMANYSWLHMENPVLASPEHKLYGGVNFRKGRWSASTGIQYVKGFILIWMLRQKRTSCYGICREVLRRQIICHSMCVVRTCWRNVMRSMQAILCRKRLLWVE